MEIYMLPCRKQIATGDWLNDLGSLNQCSVTIQSGMGCRFNPWLGAKMCVYPQPQTPSATGPGGAHTLSHRAGDRLTSFGGLQRAPRPRIDPLE